jgi:lipoprotein signal peptidase
MVISHPKTVYSFLGFFVFLAVLDGILRFGFVPWSYKVCNTGIGLGLAIPSPILWLSITLLLCIAGYQAWTRSALIDCLAWAAILIGGTVNAIDRSVRGCVTDYITLPFFPSFNLADMMLSLGVALLLVTTLGMMPKVSAYVR